MNLRVLSRISSLMARPIDQSRTISNRKKEWLFLTPKKKLKSMLDSVAFTIWATLAS